MKKLDSSTHKTIDEFIQQGLDSLLKSPKENSSKSKETYFDKYKIKLKKKRLKTALRSVSAKSKYRKFFGSTTDPDFAHGPANAQAMDSSPVGDISAPVDAGGYGVGEYGVTGFGESINRNAKEFIKFISRMKTENSDPEIIKTIADGYKKVYANIEQNTTAILCGIQPSMIDHMRFDIDDLVFSLNNFGGEIISVYIGEANEMEPESIIKEWYKDIGVEQDVIDNIFFVEKATEEIEETLLDLPFNTTKNELAITSNDDIDMITENTTNPILIGCADLYFLPDFMVSFARQGIKYQMDTKFMFMV
jgi:hypothetical protein